VALFRDEYPPSWRIARPWFGELDEIRDLKATQKAPAIFAASHRPL
jgi:hypothetical protein